MSPNVGNFVHDLVEMAKAMETLPQVQSELDDARHKVETLHDTVAERELRILSLKAEIEALNEKVRASEVAKDQAETMFLEADDRTTRALEFVKTVFGSAGGLIQALEPPKPTPVAEVVPIATSQGQSASPFNPAQPVETRTASTLESASAEASFPTPSQAEPMHEAQPQGQSESPLPPSDATLMTSASTNDVQTSDADNIAQPSPQPGPYAGKRYIDVPGFISRSDWIEGGGTEDDYDWRSVQFSQF